MVGKLRAPACSAESESWRLCYLKLVWAGCHINAHTWWYLCLVCNGWIDDQTLAPSEMMLKLCQTGGCGPLRVMSTPDFMLVFPILLEVQDVEMVQQSLQSAMIPYSGQSMLYTIHYECFPMLPGAGHTNWHTCSPSLIYSKIWMTSANRSSLSKSNSQREALNNSK